MWAQSYYSDNAFCALKIVAITNQYSCVMYAQSKLSEVVHLPKYCDGYGLVSIWSEAGLVPAQLQGKKLYVVKLGPPHIILRKLSDWHTQESKKSYGPRRVGSVRDCGTRTDAPGLTARARARPVRTVCTVHSFRSALCARVHIRMYIYQLRHVARPLQQQRRKAGENGGNNDQMEQQQRSALRSFLFFYIVFACKDSRTALTLPD